MFTQKSVMANFIFDFWSITISADNGEQIIVFGLQMVFHMFNAAFSERKDVSVKYRITMHDKNDLKLSSRFFHVHCREIKSPNSNGVLAFLIVQALLD